MRLTDIISQNKPTLSFEVFPPKTWDNFETVRKTVEEIAMLSPSYMSVTYGAGGGTSDFTVSLAAGIRDKFAVPTLSHLTCVSSDRNRIKEEMKKLSDNSIENVLALRGDIPEGTDRNTLSYKYATELIREIKEYGDFCIGGACYPEGHPESSSVSEDIEHLKEKTDAGCEFLTTQMFFDNDIFYNFLYKALAKGINVPVIPGIMPITTPSSVSRIVKMSGSLLPKRFVRIVERFEHDPVSLTEAGIAYATEQIVDLYSNGVNAVHVYSMNKPEVAKGIKNNLIGILGESRKYE